MNGGSGSEVFDVCFWQIMDPDILNSNDTFIYLKGNVASITGYDIYAGTVKNCFSLINHTGQVGNFEKFLIYHVQSLLMCFIGCFPGSLQGSFSLVARTDAGYTNHSLYCTNCQHKA